jgi:sugar lactone lactonase YvrE
MDTGGHLVIADKQNNRLVRLTNQLTPVGKESLSQLLAQQRPLMVSMRIDFPRTPTSLCRSTGSTFLVTFSDDYCIVQVNELGASTIVLGAPAATGLVFPGYAHYIPETKIRQTLLNLPTCVVQGPDGAIYFIERGFQVVRVYRPGQGIRGVMLPADPYQTGPLPDAMPLTLFRCRYPTGLALLPTGELLVSDSRHHAVVQINLTRQTVQCIYRSQRAPLGGAPAAVTVGPDGTLWVLDPGDGLVVGLSRVSGQWQRVASRCSTLNEGEELCSANEGAGILCG